VVEHTAEPAPRRRWLTDLAALHDGLAATPTLGAAAKAAITDASDPTYTAGHRASYGELVEERLLARLADPAIASALSVEACEAAAEVELHDVPKVVGLTVEAVPASKAPCDLLLHWWHHPGRPPTTIPVNVKAPAAADRGSAPLACALAPLVNYLTNPAADIRYVPHGLNPDAVLVDLLAGSRELVAHRDYYLLSLVHRDYEFERVELRGLVSRMNVGGTALGITRHASRANVLYERAGAVVAPGFDVARALATALLPVPREGHLAAYLLAVVDGPLRPEYAALLDGLADAEIVALLGGPAVASQPRLPL